MCQILYSVIVVLHFKQRKYHFLISNKESSVFSFQAKRKYCKYKSILEITMKKLTEKEKSKC